jgi:heat shock protein HslJ
MRVRHPIPGMRTLLVAAVALVLVAGCGDDEQQAAQGPAALEGTPWVLTGGLDVDGWEDVAPSATFAQGTVSGSSGCNRYSASYTMAGDKLALGEPLGTRMACEPAVTAVEDAFRAALQRVSRWRVTDEELVLLDGVEELLRFRAASPIGDWTVTSFLQRDAVTGPLAGTEITATFDDDGMVSGSTGCNRYTAAFTLEAGALTIAPPVATRTKCVQPGLMEQEQLYLEALPLTASYSVEGSMLTLLTKAGTIVATYARAGS